MIMKCNIKYYDFGHWFLFLSGMINIITNCFNIFLTVRLSPHGGSHLLLYHLILHIHAYLYTTYSNQSYVRGLVSRYALSILGFYPYRSCPHLSGHLPFVYRFNDQSPTVYTYIKLSRFTN
jgi:hypothetical protein